MPTVFKGGAFDPPQPNDAAKAPVKFGSGNSDENGGLFTFHVPNKVDRTYGSKINRSRKRDISLESVDEDGPPSQFVPQTRAAFSRPGRPIIDYKIPASIPERRHHPIVQTPISTYTLPTMAEALMQYESHNQTAAKPKKKHPTCTHPNMVRVYSLTLRCDNCLNHGSFGWLYLCSQDREGNLCHDVQQRNPQATFDLISKQLSSLVKPRPRGPEERADKFAFFKEVSAEQMATYTPDQIKRILQQREHVKAVLKEDKERRRLAEVYPPSFEHVVNMRHHLEDEKPWIVRREEECGYVACHNCRPGHADRAYLSLDGIADGHVPATAATGFGFHIFGQRPVCDATLVANLPDGDPVQPASSVVAQITSITSTPPGSTPDTELTSATPSDNENNGPRASESASASEHAASEDTAQDSSSLKQPLAAPAPAPRAARRQRILPLLRKTLGFPLWNLKDGYGSNDRLGFFNRPPPVPRKTWVDTSEELPCIPQAEEKVAAKDIATDLADTLPRLVVTSPDGHVHEQPATSMEQREMFKGHFEAKPLQVADGVAVLEESVELHVPDLMTQV